MSSARRRLSPSLIALTGALAVVVLGAAAGGKRAEIAAILLIAVIVGIAAIRLAVSWQRLVACALIVDLLLPSDGRYMLIGGAGFFQLAPYRVVIGLMLIGWFAALLVDARVHARATRFEGPLGVITIATLGSMLVNAGAVNGAKSDVIKALLVFASLVLFMYLIVSVVRTRDSLERLLTIAVIAGVVEAAGALVQRQTGFNIFDHLHRFIPMFQFNLSAELTGLLRGGDLRALSSAGHPIELSNTMAMLMPIAAYLAISKHQRRWWAAFVMLLIGLLSSGSKTGFLELLAMLLIFIWLRPRQTLKCWPALAVLAVLASLLMPSAINGIIQGFFPKGGFIHSQSTVSYSRGVQDNTRLSRLGPVIHNEFDAHSRLFGEGYGVRQTGRDVRNGAQILDDQWLDNLVGTGILGVAGWLWMFAHVVRKLGKRAKVQRGTPSGWLPVALAASITGYAVSMVTYDAFGFIQATLLLYALFAFASVTLGLSPDARPPDIPKAINYA